MWLWDWLFGTNDGQREKGQPTVDNLRLWRESGQPRQWVQEHQGRWDHEDWLALLKTLQGSEYWPMEADAVGRVLEEMKQEWMKR